MKIILDSQETYNTTPFKCETLIPLPSQKVLCHPTFQHFLDILSYIMKGINLITLNTRKEKK